MNEMLRFVPSSTPVRTRQGSKLFPPLGTLKTETRHLNFRWSVARLDALKTLLTSSRHISIAEIGKAFNATDAEITQLAHELAILVRHPHT